MGVVNLKSGPITNRDATPEVLNNPSVESGHVREACGLISAGAADSSTSTYRIAQVPSNARISQVLIWNATFGGSCAADFGIAETTANGGAIVSGLDGDEIAAAVNLHQTNTALDITHQGGEESALSNGEKPLWQMLGLSADPCKMYDVVATLTANASSGGALLVKVRYVQ